MSLPFHFLRWWGVCLCEYVCVVELSEREDDNCQFSDLKCDLKWAAITRFRTAKCFDEFNLKITCANSGNYLKYKGL